MIPPTTHARDVEAPIPFSQQVSGIQRSWKAEAKALGRLATAVGPLTKPALDEDLAKLEEALAKVGKKVQAIPEVEKRGRAFLKEVEAEIERRRAYMRDNLARELRDSCVEAGLEMKVLRKEEPVEVRIPPFAVVIDRTKGKAEIRFARHPLASCAAEADAIVETHRKLVEDMKKGFDAARFFEACHTAWLAARASGQEGIGDRVEIRDFLPYLALQFQPRAFRVEPTQKNFRGYSRGLFAFDLLQLRNAGGLSRGDLRLNLGVATGTSATKKNRALFVENEHGDGEYKLTVFFTRKDGSR